MKKHFVAMKNMVLAGYCPITKFAALRVNDIRNFRADHNSSNWHVSRGKGLGNQCQTRHRDQVISQKLNIL